MKKIILTVFIVIFFIAGAYSLFIYPATKTSGQAVNTGEIQKITLGMSGYSYTPNTIRVKAGTPVEITLDNSVGGCFRAFKIFSLGVSKYSQSPSDTIKFTPEKPGTYRYSCSMGMASGNIIVE